MTPGWRRWTAILTTYICLFAGVIAYRIRVPPPGQLVALSGDDLRVELDLPPPGRVDGGGGGLLEAAVTPDSRSRRQGDAGGVEDASARAVRRDGELWIELVDMEMGVEIARRRRKEAEEEEAEGEERRRRLQEAGGGGGTKREGGRWRREEGGGSGGGETMGRREIGGGWNSVGDSEGKEAEGKKKSKEEEEEVQTKEGKRRYEWVAGGVRPKGEKENALRATGKESEGPNKWAGGDRWGGKMRWRSWNGRTGGFGGGSAVKMTDDLEKSGAREKKGGGGVAGGAGGQKSQEEPVGEGEAAREAGKDGEEGDGEGEEDVRGLILETALVSRGWHLPASAASPWDPPDRGPSPPHSTLALTFPASHFTHGGLYVVRLVGTGRVVSNPGTQRPQRDTVTTEGALEGAGGGSGTDGRRGDENHAKEEGRKPEGTREAKIGGVPVVTDKRGGKNETAGSGKKGKLLVSGEKEGVGGERGRKVPAMNLPPASRSDDVHRGREEVRTEGGEDKETVKRMYGRILEALENRERWEEYDKGAVPPDRKSSGGMDGSGTLSGRRVGRRRKREETGDSSGSRQKTADERRRDPRPPLQEGGGLPSAAEGEVRGLKRPDSAVSDYGESLLGGVRHKTAGQWLSGGIGGRVVSKSWGDREEKLSEERESGEDSERMKALEGLTATRRGGGTSEEVSGTEMNGSPSSFLRTYLEDKASDGGGKRGKDAAGRKGYREEGDVASASEVEVKRRRRNEEGNYFDEPVIDRLSLSPGTENYDFADLHRFSSMSSRLQKRDLEESTEEGTIENTETNTSQNTSTTEEVPKYATTEGRVSREVSKGCKDNCETTATSRHILAEENVLVSWPAARFTLNILSSSSSFSSSATKPQTEKSARNLTFETFEAPVRVLVEIPCGIEGVGLRGRREVVVEGLRKTFYAQESGESGRMSVKVSKDESAMEAGKSTGRLRVMSTAMQENQKDGEGESDTKDNTGAEASREGGEPKRKKKGARGENERLWKDLESGGRGREKRELKGEQNHLGWAPGIPPGGAVTERMLTAGDGEEEAYHAEEYTEANSPRGIVMRIRKERVTKYDINDDALESLEEKAGSLGSSGYAMKREVSAGLQEPTREVKSVPGERIPMGPERSFKVEPWMTNEDDQASRGGDADGRSGGHSAGGPTRVKRAPTTAGSTRNPKTGLSPGPPKLPFRVFLVLRYCGVDSTECDEEDSGKDNVEIWRRPQTVFTKELVDFPACPKYQHQVILPCEAFGQAGVYVVQVRSNYTLEAVEVGGGAGKAQGRRRRKRRAEGETVGDQPEERLTSKQSNKYNNHLSGITGTKTATESSGGDVTDDSERRQSGDVNVFVAESTSRIYDGMRVGKSTTDTLGIARGNGRINSKGSPKDPEDIQDRGDVKRKRKGDLQGRRGHEEEVLGTTFGGGTGMFDAASEEGVGEGRPPPLSRKPRGSAWEMGGSSWWEFGSGDGGGDTDEGSGDWGEGGGWPDDAGRGRREGSGDAEYGDDPDGGSDPGQSSSRRKLPDPPPGSLWTSSESITVRLSTGYVFTVHARSVFPCSDAHVRPGTLEPAPSGVPVLFEYPECILDASDRIRVFGRARPDVAAILPPFWMGTDASTDAAVTLSHPSLRYVAEKKIYKGKHNAWFDCSLFTERYSEYCFAYASEAMTGAVTHVRAQCIPTLPTSDKDRGGWGSWSSWSQCSTTCGSGSRNRYRTCDNPPPRYGAPFCEGPALETEICPPPTGVTYEELQEMCPLGLALNAADDANRKGNEPNCRCGGCVVHLQGVAGSWTSRNAGPIKPRARLIASSSQACPGRSFWLLQAEPGHVVGLTVSSLLLPCPRRQWLKARDGDSLSSRLVLHLPSSASAANGAPAYSTEALCFSTGPHLLLEFYSFERLEASCNGGFLAHAHQVLANSSASAIGRDILLTPTTRAVPRSSLSVHAVALAFILALLALSGGLALNYVVRRRRFNEELKKREKEEEEMSDSDSDTKCFIARNKDGGSATSVTSVSDVISLRKLSVGKDRKERREVHMRLTEESDEDDEEEEEEDGGGVGRRGEGVAGKEEEGTTKSSDHNEPAKANLPRVEVLRPGPLKRKRSGGARSRRRARVETAARGGVRGVVVEEEEEEEDVEEDVEEGGGGQQEDVQGDEEKGGGGGGGEEEDEGADGVVAPEVTRRRRRKAGGSVGRREWRESACPLLEPETPVAQSSISLPSSPTEALAEDPAVTPNAPGRPGLSASAPLLLRRSLSFFAATASASSAGASGDAPPEGGGVAQSISAAGKQWWRKKMQRFQNGSVSPVREELEETWRLAEPHSPGKKKDAKAKKRPGAAGGGDAAPPAKECKEKQNRERLLRAGGSASPVVLPGVHHHAPSPNASESPSATTSPEMSRPGSNGGGRLRGRLLRATRAADGKCTSEASLAGGASELDLEFDYYDYNVQNAGAAPGSYLGMDPAFLVYIPPFEGSTSPSSNASSASTLQAPPSEGGTDALLSASSSPQPPKGGGAATHRGDYYCINASYARANFQEMNGSRNGVAGGSEGEMMSMAEFRRSSVEDEEEEEESEEGRGSEKETRVEKSPVEDVEELEEDEIKFADEDDDEEEEEEDSERAKMEGTYGVITAEGVGLKKPV